MTTENNEQLRLVPDAEGAEAPVLDAPVVEAPAPEPVSEAPAPVTPSVEVPVAPIVPEPAVQPYPGAAVRQPINIQEHQRLQQENAALRQQQEGLAAQHRAQTLRQQANEAATARSRQLVELGYFTDDQSNLVTQEIQQAYEQVLGTQQQVETQKQFFEGKANAAMYYGDQYGISPKDLMAFNTPQDMERHGLNQQEIQRLKTQVARLTKAEAPLQQFDSGVPQSSSGQLEGAQLERAVGEGSVEFTPEVAQRLIAYHKQEGFIG